MNSLGRMVSCAAGDLCELPLLLVSATHKCSVCNKYMHGPCGVPSDLSNSRFQENDIMYALKCHECASSSAAATSTGENIQALNTGCGGRGAGRGRGTSGRGGRGGRGSTRSITSNKPSDARQNDVAKSVIPDDSAVPHNNSGSGGRGGGKGRGGSSRGGRGGRGRGISLGELVPDKALANDDIFVGKKIALACKGDLELRLRTIFSGEIPRDALKSGHVVGQVMAPTPGKRNLYNVTWEFTGIPPSQVSQLYLLDGIQAAARLEEEERRSTPRARTPSLSESPLMRSRSLRNALLRVSPGEEGVGYESDSSNGSASDEEEFNCDDITWFHHGDSREIDQAEQEQIESHNIENLNGLSWNCNGT
ncbi:MAG: hypothetical protein ACREBR_02220, partial [bacterium]